MKTISVAESFSRYPAGRYIDDGPYSGQRFRDEHLSVALNKLEPVIVELDGVRGYGSSFLEEAFGGLVRIGHSKEQVKELIHLKSDDPSLIEEIIFYIDHAND